MWHLVRAVAVAALLAGGMVAPGMSHAQDRAQTLADIRQEMTVLYVELQKLKRELSTTGGARANLAAAGTLERLDQLEQELGRLTSKTEELENRINRIVKDGTNRLGDLEFRLVELEGGDVSKLGETTTLGGDMEAPALTDPANPEPAEDAPELAVGEKRDFARAKDLLEQGDAKQAAQLLARFKEDYPGSPLAPDVDYFHGEALLALGDTANAARAYLDSFSASPNGGRAPDALYKLGLTLGDLGQKNEACISLGEVATRFPGAPAIADAQKAMQDLGCP